MRGAIYSVRVFLASTFIGLTKADRSEFIAKGKPKYILETYFNGESQCKQALCDAGVDNFLLDSGAFSFMSGAQCSKESLWKYAEQYAEFIIRNGVKYYFELDVDTIYGIEFVEKIRTMLEQRSGVKCIPVWHKGRGVEYFKRMCREYDYIAIGGLVFHVKQSEWELIRKLVQYAYMHGVKVHGLGFTKTKELEKYKWYSVDSSSWTKAAARGQQRHDFVNGQIVARKINGNGQRVYLSKLITHNGIEWCKYQRYMDGKRW